MGNTRDYTAACVLGVSVSYADALRLIRETAAKGTNPELSAALDDWGDDYASNASAIVQMLGWVFKLHLKQHYSVTAMTKRVLSTGVSPDMIGYVVGVPVWCIEPEGMIQLQETHATRIVELVGNHIARPAPAFHFGIA